MMDKKRKKVEQYIEQYQMIGRGDRIVTGVSGGADSVCLLFVLCELRKKLGFEVIVCHVNHQLRAEAAEQDEAYVKELCRKLDVPCRIFHENVELIAKNGKKSLEEAGRIVRSNAFETVCRESGANKIATAHHKNDNAETVLLNLARGSGLQGMCGIRPVYGNRIRPLLCLTRKEIEEWLEEEQISYCTDETNEEDEYTRNRIRHKILPVMEQEINRQTVEHINRLSLQAEEIWEYLNLQTDAAWRQMVHPVDVSEENPEEKQQGKKEEKPAGLRIEEEEYANMVMDAYERLSGLVMTWEEEDANQDAYVPGNRFRIAIRAKLYTPYPDGLLNIYHVMVQLRDGSWASKMNTSPSRWCGLINVRTDSNEDNWDTLANPNLEYRHTMFFQVQGSYAP